MIIFKEKNCRCSVKYLWLDYPEMTENSWNNIYSYCIPDGWFISDYKGKGNINKETWVWSSWTIYTRRLVYSIRKIFFKMWLKIPVKEPYGPTEVNKALYFSVKLVLYNTKIQNKSNQAKQKAAKRFLQKLMQEVSIFLWKTIF